jgi:hypothetical protein
MTKRMPHSAMSSREGDALMSPKRGGPKIIPASNSPSMTGRPNRVKTLPRIQATMRIRRILSISSLVIIG